MAENIVKPKDLAPITQEALAADDLLTVYDKSNRISKKLSISEADERWSTGGGDVETGNLTSPTNGVSISGGTDAVVGSGTTISIQTASDSQPGLLSAADHTAFAAKQAAGNYITALTGDVTASGPGSVAATIANNAVSNAKLATVATARIKGRSTSGTGNVEDLTGTQVTALLDSFAGSAKGLVPAASGGDSAKYLKGDGSWGTVASGSGDVVGPSSSVDKTVAIFDSTTGKLLKQGTPVTIDPATGDTVFKPSASNPAPVRIGLGAGFNAGGTFQYLSSNVPADNYTEHYVQGGTGYQRNFYWGEINRIFHQKADGTSGMRFDLATPGTSKMLSFDLTFAGIANFILADDGAESVSFSILANGDFMFPVGKSASYKAGSNAKMGQVTLSAGAATVSTTAFKSTSKVFLSRDSFSGFDCGQLSVGTKVNGTSFEILSLDATGGTADDSSVVNWVIFDTIA
jgi:hypothetical protein